MAEWQLCQYRIEDGHLDDFLGAWLAGVLPLRRAFGFEVTAWTIPDEQRFVWLLRWEGPEPFAEAESRYYASPDRAAISPDPAQWIAEKRTDMLTPVL